MSLLTQKILTFALRAGLESPKNVKLISRGVASETYQLFDGKKKYIVIRFLQDEKNFRPNLLTLITRFFDKMGFPIPKLIATGQIDHFEAVLTEFAKGKVNPTWEIANYERLGFLIGNLHLSQKEFCSSYEGPSILEDMFERMSNLEDALPQEFNAVYNEIEELEKIWPTHLPSGIIHGDLWYKNVLFENGEISAILDYLTPYNDCLIYDLATVMKGIYFSHNCHNQDEKFNSFIKCYEYANPLSSAELDALPIMLRAKILYTILFMLEQASINKLHRESFLCTAMFNLIKLQESAEISFEKISL